MPNAEIRLAHQEKYADNFNFNPIDETRNSIDVELECSQRHVCNICNSIKNQSWFCVNYFKIKILFCFMWKNFPNADKKEVKRFSEKLIV